MATAFLIYLKNVAIYLKNVLTNVAKKLYNKYEIEGRYLSLCLKI